MVYNNRVSKYLLYAVGEIILVVIGILIALQINNWNEQRKESKQEHAILMRLKQEFISNKNQLETKMEIRNDVVDNGRQLLEFYLNPGDNAQDSLYIKLSRLITPATFDPVKNDLVSSGNLEILKSERLKRLLINWSTDVIQLQEVEQMFVIYHGNSMIPYFEKAGILRNVSDAFWNQEQIILLESDTYSNPISGESKLIGPTTKEILNDIELEGIISHTITLNVVNNEESKTLMKRIEEILTAINSEIKND